MFTRFLKTQPPTIPQTEIPFGVSTNLLYRHKIKDAVRQEAESGFQHLELQFEHGARHCTHPQTQKILIQLKEDYSLSYNAHAPFIGIDLASDNEQVRRYSCQVILMVIHFCADLDVKCLTVHTGGRSPTGVKQLHHSLDELVFQAKRLGISICLENTATDRLAWLFLSPEHCLKLCQQTGCQLTLDLIHLWSSHLEPLETLQQLLPYAGNIHIADTLDDRHFHLPLGFGNLPIDQIFEILANSSYSGKVVVDGVHQDYEFPLYLKQAQFYRERLLGRLR